MNHHQVQGSSQSQSNFARPACVLRREISVPDALVVESDLDALNMTSTRSAHRHKAAVLGRVPPANI
ncbi:unnamed protein product [Pylaiella littoralis]